MKSEMPNIVADTEWNARRPLALAGAGLLLGLITERLFYDRALGVSFPLWVAAILIALLVSAWYEDRRPAPAALALLVPTVALAALVPLRVEPMTTFLAVVLTLGLLAVQVRLFRPGGFLHWGWLDLALAGVWVPLEAWLRPWPTLASVEQKATGGERAKARTVSVVRGLILALPVLIIFTALLSAADLVFGDMVEQALAWLNLERLLEFFGRATFVLLAALFLLGALVAALRRSEDEPVVRQGKPLVPAFLGMIETLIVLGAVDLIFLLFVAVQFRYFFGGEANITATAYTYAEYARQGFGELVFAGALALGLIFTLAAVSRREAQRDRRLFDGFSVGLVAMVMVMLVSAFQRLLLYEQAYGFTRLRSYTHVFILWLGLLFAGFVVLLVRDQLRRFAPASLLAAVGFALSLAALNVDVFIVRQNFQHQQSIGQLDAWYLTTLSDDAVPAIVARLDRVPDDERPTLLAGLSCRRHILAERAETSSWPSFRLPAAQAASALEAVAGQLADYPIEEDEWGSSQITLDEDEIYYCGSYGW